MHELAQARETVAKLAANEERLRLARDMHDLTGQSLSMITLKSELAAKRLARLPSSAERDAVLTELGDIGRVSRQTLHDIREAVSGYRRPTLAIEVITARNALEAAGIAARRRRRADPAVGHVRPGRRGGAGLVPARGRHQRDPPFPRPALPDPARPSARASCPSRSPTTAAASPARTTNRPTPGRPGQPQGSGLRGMSERLSAIGGRLSLGPAGGQAGPRLPPHRDRARRTTRVRHRGGDRAHNCKL